MPITTLFLDIGGVLLTNGWDHNSRRLAAKTFDLDYDEMADRHRLNFDVYEQGKLTLDEYLDRVVFHQARRFTRDRFRSFMYEQSVAYPEMIELFTRLKVLHKLKIAVVSNEGRELTEYRVRKFQLGKLADTFISSCFVGLRKPDADIFRLALDVVQTPLQQVLYVENTALFVEVAEGLGIQSLLHKDFSSTRETLATLGLQYGDADSS